MAIYPMSKRDADQVLRYAFDDATGRLRVDAEVSVGSIPVEIDATSGDNIAISDGTDTLLINSDGSINVAVTGDIEFSLSAADGDNVAISDGTNQLEINPDGSINSVVIATNLDIRNLTFAQDKADISGSTVTLDAGTLSALESVTVQNPAGASAVNIQDGGNSLTVDAIDLDIRNLIFAQDKVDASGSIIALDSATLTALELITVQNPSGIGAVNIQDGGNSITVDGTIALDSASLSALESITVQNLAGASAVNIQDGGNSITVDGTVALDSASLAALESITVQNGTGSSAVNIQDGGNSVTVDATDLDIRDITHVTDSIKLGDGVDFLAINSDGSLTVTASSTIANVTGSASANNIDIIPSMEVLSYDTILIHNIGTFNLSTAAQFSNDNVNWVAGLGVTLLSASQSPTNNLNTTATIYKVPVSGRYFRYRTTAYTSGTITAFIALSSGDIHDLNGRIDSITNSVTVTGTIAGNVITATGTGAALNATPIALTTVSAYDVMALAITGTWVATLLVEGTIDGATFFPIPLQRMDTLTDPPQLSITQNGNYKVPINLHQVRVRVSAYTSGTVSATARISPWDSEGLANKTVIATDYINGGTGVQGAVSVGTSAVEARVGGSALANRKNLTVFNNSSNILYWGFTSAVTTSTGTPIIAGDFWNMAVGPAQAVYVIAGTAGNDARITEAS